MSLAEVPAPLARSQRYSLRFLLETMHKMLGGPLSTADRGIWLKGTNEFQESANAAVKYQQHGYRHSSLFRIDGLAANEMIDWAV